MSMSRGLTYEQIFKDGDWNMRADLAAAKKRILSAWRETKKILTPPEPLQLRPWQQECLDIVQAQDDRTVTWIRDSDGNNGKTVLCKEMALHYKAAVFGNAGKKDLSYAYNDQEIIAFNLTRTTTDRINYESIEAFKDGLMFSGKYESETKVFNSPNMLVMSNELPNYKAMSADRWQVYDLREGR